MFLLCSGTLLKTNPEMLYPIIIAHNICFCLICIFVRTKSRPYRNHGRLGFSKGEVKGEAVSGQHTAAIIRSYCCRDRMLGIFMLYNCCTVILRVLVVSLCSVFI